jgi:hypothetical protein
VLAAEFGRLFGQGRKIAPAICAGNERNWEVASIVEGAAARLGDLDAISGRSGPQTSG